MGPVKRDALFRWLACPPTLFGRASKSIYMVLRAGYWATMVPYHARERGVSHVRPRECGPIRVESETTCMNHCGNDLTVPDITRRCVGAHCVPNSAIACPRVRL